MDIQVVDFENENADKQFCQSLVATGFGVLRNHPIAHDFLDDLYASWFNFFQSAEKEQYHFNVETQDGFFPLSVSETAKGFNVKDFKEYFHYYPWGQCPAELKAKTDELYRKLAEMGATLLRWLEENSPQNVREAFSMPLPQMIEDSEQTLLRILHYPPLSDEMPAGSVRAGEHGDINLLTLLVSAKGSGLQVRDANNEWLDVPCDPNSIIVNVGDMLEMASQNHYRSTLHRVVNPEGAGANESRMSIPLFLHARPDVRLSAQHTAGSFLAERLRELGVKP